MSRPTLCPSVMQCNNLNAHEVIARCNTRWHSEVMPPCVRNHGIHSPLAVREAILRNFEPLQTCSAGSCSIVDFGEIVLNWTYNVSMSTSPSPRDSPTLVRSSDRIVLVVGALCSTDDMSPPCANLCTCWDSDHSAVCVRDAFIAGEVGVVYILNWII
jgi:hypothetical protein